MIASPFKALRPKKEYAQRVVAPPYDVVSTEEASQLYQDNNDSFISVSRPEVTMNGNKDLYSEAVYKRGKENLDLLIDKELLEREDKPCYYVYQINTSNHIQTGLSLVGSVEAYLGNRIKKHELTRPEKENDRINNIDFLNAQTGPVLGVYRDDPAIHTIIHKVVKEEVPILSAKGPNKSQHSIWKIDNHELIKTITNQFEKHEAIYIADGHHRSAAAANVCSQRSASQTDTHNYFLMTIFPESEMLIHDYNRVVHDDKAINKKDLFSYLNKHFKISIADNTYKPNEPYDYGMYFDKQWFRLTYKDKTNKISDPVESLDVSLLQNKILNAYFQILDPRLDPRISFIGGVRGLQGIEDAVDKTPNSVGFSLFATSMSQLMAVADANQLMPPKSTWFEPKLLDGLLSHVLD